jgi:hypothetical protein
VSLSPLEAAANFERILREVVVTGDHEYTFLTLWEAHVHAFPAFDTTAYAGIISPEKRCGKSVCLSVLQWASPTPEKLVSPSPAALFWLIDRERPALFIDEIDTLFGHGKASGETQEALRAIFNEGFQEGAVIIRRAGADNSELERYSIFCPKAFAGIGYKTLPETVKDRTVFVRLERKSSEQKTRRISTREERQTVKSELSAVAEGFSAWASSALDQLEKAKPFIPTELDDRAADIWEPLLAVADELGGDWPQRAREAAVALSTGTIREDALSHRLQLLTAIRRIFDNQATEEISTRDLLHSLSEDDEAPTPYSGSWWFGGEDGEPGRGAPKYLANVLEEFHIRPLSIWIDGKKQRGYRRDWFEKAWERYLDETPGLPSVGVPPVPPVPRAHGYAENSGTDSPTPPVPTLPASVPERTAGNGLPCPSEPEVDLSFRAATSSWPTNHSVNSNGFCESCRSSFCPGAAPELYEVPA